MDTLKTSPKNAVVLSDVTIDDNVTNHNFRHAKFENVGATGKCFLKCDFSFAHFDRCYFRNCIFKDCIFRGARFMDSAFTSSKFVRSIMDHARFSNTVGIDRTEMVKNTPAYPNVARELFRDLRINAKGLGNIKDERVYIREELKRERQYWREAAEKPDAYYSERYSGFKNWWLTRCNKWMLYVDLFFLGHGEYLWRIVVVAFFVPFVFSTFDTKLFCHLDSDGLTTAYAQYLSNLDDAWRTFLGLSHSLDGGGVKHESSLVFDAFLVGLRYVFLGIVAAAIVRRTQWR